MSHKNDNILIIESPNNWVNSVKTTLAEAGFNVSVINSASEGKEKIRFTSYSLILLSRELPDIIDPIKFIREIKKFYPETIVILMFDKFSNELMIDATRAGTYDFFDKKGAIEDLCLIVKKSLDRRRLGLKNKQLFNELHKKNLELEWRVKELSALYEISQTIASQPTLEEALNGLFMSIKKVMPVDYFLCLSFNQDNQMLHLRFARGIKEDIVKELSFLDISSDHIRTEDMITGDENREDMIAYYTDYFSNFFRNKGFYKLLLESFLAVPIFVEKDLYGLFVIASDKKDVFSEEHRKLLSIIASQALSIYEKTVRLTKSTQLITMGQMITEISHDLRHPITSIKGVLQNLEKKWYDDSFRKKSLEIVNNSLFRLNELVKELLEFSNPDRFPLKMIDINQTLNKVLIIVQNDLLRHKIDLIQEISVLPPIQINEERIKEVFLNLIVNAIDAMEGGGVLKISTGLTDKSNDRLKQYVQINFKDTGIGIKRCNLNKIFDHFFSTKSSGIGLGLAIVNRVIKTHNGFIEVMSEEGKGTTFSIHLPVNPEC